MTEQKKKLLSSLISGEISKDIFIQEYSQNEEIDSEYCLTLLEHSYENKDDNAVEEAIIIGTTIDCFSNKFSEIFCKLLVVDWHYKHEDIARILQNLKDPSTVKCLYEAALLQFDYLSYDDTYQFGRKCIKALSAIDSSEAREKLLLLTQSSISEIKQYAIKELDYEK